MSTWHINIIQNPGEVSIGIYLRGIPPFSQSSYIVSSYHIFDQFYTRIYFGSTLLSISMG